MGMSDAEGELVAAPAKAAAGSFVSHAKVIGAITLISRVLGLAREMIAANYFGAGVVLSAWKVAFTIPNLFRKLLGEGALSAAFIPLYAQALKHQSPYEANDFANASVNLQALILIALTIVGEAILAFLYFFVDLRPDHQLCVKLTAIMLPYVMLVCGAALLGGILNVHHRFTAAAATAIVSNVCLIVALLIVAAIHDLRTPEGQLVGVKWLSWAVLVAGALQLAILMPSLRAVGFRFRLLLHFWTPAIRRMLWMTGPVALSAGVLQIGVMLDKGISFLLARGADAADTHFTLLGASIRYPMAPGAAARLDLAQFMYQFPLGVFAIALATAIFPKLSRDAEHDDLQKITATPEFRSVLRRGVEASLFIGLPASVGMVLVARPAVALLFEQGRFTPEDTAWVALSTAIYSAAIWAFSLQQILNRAYYALHDTVTPLIWGAVNLLMNLVVELPLIWTRLGESGMAVGTLVSFSIQSVMMLWMINRRIGGMGLRQSVGPVAKMLLACAAMLAACLVVQRLPFFPHGTGKVNSAMQLSILMAVGGAVYFVACALMGLDVLRHIKPRRKRV